MPKVTRAGGTPGAGGSLGSIGVTWPLCPPLGQGAEPWLTAAIQWVAVGTVRLVQLTGQGAVPAQSCPIHTGSGV